MEKAIEALEDRIIMISGRIVTVAPVGQWEEVTKMIIVKQWEEEIEELKKAQSILSNCS